MHIQLILSHSLRQTTYRLRRPSQCVSVEGKSYLNGKQMEALDLVKIK